MPLDSVLDVYLCLADRGFKYSAIAAGETGDQSCIWTLWVIQAKG